MARNMMSQWNPLNEEDAQHRSSRRSGGRNNAALLPFPVSYFGPLSNFYRDIDQMFENVFTNFARTPFSPMGLQEMFRPKVDIAATDREYTIIVEAPGMDENDLQLNISADNTLTIRGEKRQENEDQNRDYQRVERSYGRFERTLSLPDDIDQEDINATCKNGVVTITLPRKEQSRRQQSRQIEIQAGGQQQGQQGQRDRNAAYSSGEGSRSAAAGRENTSQNREHTGGPKKAA